MGSKYSAGLHRDHGVSLLQMVEDVDFLVGPTVLYDVSAQHISCAQKTYLTLTWFNIGSQGLEALRRMVREQWLGMVLCNKNSG